MNNFQILQWIPLKKELDEYLFVAINYKNSNIPDYNRLYFSKFNGHCEIKGEAHNVDYDLFEMIIRNRRNVKITEEQKIYIEDIIKQNDSDYKEKL